ncbi:MAG: hypothetical protein WA958_21660 [Tunicatimonas sp.]
MNVNEKTIFEIFKKLKKSELIEHLKSSFYEMDDRQRRDVFLELQNSVINKNLKPKELYPKILEFHKKSITGEYYAPFDINSNNFMHIPNETDEWFSELSYYLDETSKLVEKKEYGIANKCFEKLYESIEEMKDGEVVFADEYGTWMISTKLDYDNFYIISLSQTEDENKFAEKVVPLLRRDSYESLSSKIYSKIRKSANSKQFRKVQEEIKSKNIRIK